MPPRAFGRETKYQKVRMDLETLTNRLQPEDRLPPLREMATSLGTSVSTLSGVLEELEREELVYRRHGVGIFVSAKRSRSICVVCAPDLMFNVDQSPFWSILVEQLRQRAHQGNERFGLHFVQPAVGGASPFYEGIAREIAAGEIHGVVGIGISDAVSEWIAAQKVPYVAYGARAQYVAGTPVQPLIESGVERLISLGCRRLACWTPIGWEHGWRMSRACFGQRMDRLALPRPFEALEAIWSHHTGPMPSHRRQGFDLALKAFGLNPELRPDGLIVTDDVMTSGVLAGLNQLGLNPGQDVYIVSHCNRGTDTLLGYEDRLIRIQVDPALLASALLGALDTLIEGRVPAPETLVVPPVAI